MLNFNYLMVAIILMFSSSQIVNAKDEKHEHHQHGAHVHGEAKLTIAMDGKKSLDIVLESPADSILGFEHDAKSAKDKKTQKEVFEKLVAKAGQWLASDKLVACKAINAKPEIEKEEGEEHSEVHFSYRLECSEEITANKIEVGFFKEFKKLKKLKVAVLKESSQKEFSLNPSSTIFSLTE